MFEIVELWRYLGKRRQKQFILILCLMVISSAFEVISIGAVIPFLGIITAPEQIFSNETLRPIVSYFNFTKPNQLLLPITGAFMLAAATTGVVRLVLLYATTRFSFAAGADIAMSVYRRTLYQDYETHLSQNSSEIINIITTKTNAVISGVLNPILIFISSMVLIFFIVSALLLIDPITCLLALIGFGFFYFLVIRYTRKHLTENSTCIAKESTQIIKHVQEGLGGVRDIIIDGNQEFYSHIYRQSDQLYRRALGNNQFINGSPRFVMESIGMILIAGLAYSMSFQEGGVISAIPTLGALALGAQRILPALQQLFGSYATVKSAYASFQDVLSILNQEFSTPPQGGSLSFGDEICLRDVSFHYQKAHKGVFENLNLVIAKNSLVGFVGVTGSGKSTLIDIIMSLLKPTKGDLLIDGAQINEKNHHLWRNYIAHVPQNIFLSDATIEENIAFGIPQNSINISQLKKAVEVAQLKDLIASWPDQYKTMIGERGVRLSGGQKQRIGIARAIYKKASVLILDEATSSLDSATEQAVMKSINALGQNITILIIAHRVSTLRACQIVYKIEDGSLIEVKNL